MPKPPSGIYKITNMLNGRIYVGQSKNMFKRREQHFAALRKGVHENKLMQNDWNKNNRGFRWDVIEYCGLSELNAREKYWIDTLNTIACGYNAGWAPYKRKTTKQALKIKKYHKTR